MAETLSNLGTKKVEATEETNVTGQMTSVLAFSPNDGLEMVVKGSTGGKRGIPIYAQLQDVNGDDLPLDTNLTIRFDAPILDQPEVVAYTLSNIRQYRNLSIKEQQNEEFRDQTRIELKGSSLIVEDNEEMQIAVEASEQIDWANSQIYIDEKAVTVRSAGD